MMTKPLPAIGDPVEVRFATHDGYLWRPATVTFADAAQLCVAYAGGKREALPHGQGRYRRADFFAPSNAIFATLC